MSVHDKPGCTGRGENVRVEPSWPSGVGVCASASGTHWRKGGEPHIQCTRTTNGCVHGSGGRIRVTGTRGDSVTRVGCFRVGSAKGNQADGYRTASSRVTRKRHRFRKLGIARATASGKRSATGSRIRPYLRGCSTRSKQRAPGAAKTGCTNQHVRIGITGGSKANPGNSRRSRRRWANRSQATPRGLDKRSRCIRRCRERSTCARPSQAESVSCKWREPIRD